MLHQNPRVRLDLEAQLEAQEIRGSDFLRQLLREAPFEAQEIRASDWDTPVCPTYICTPFLEESLLGLPSPS